MIKCFEGKNELFYFFFAFVGLIPYPRAPKFLGFFAYSEGAGDGNNF